MTATLDRVPFADLATRAQANEPAGAAHRGSREAREQAFARFAAVGVPGSKDEEWRFTSVRHLATTPFGTVERSPALSARDIEPYLLGAGGLRVVVIDGRVDRELSRLSMEPGLQLTPLAGASALPEPALPGMPAATPETPFAALNAALWTDGASLFIAPGTVVEAPIEILYVATPAAGNAILSPRTIIRAGENAQVRVIENFVSLASAPYFTNAVCEIVMGKGSRVEHARVQRESSTATHIGVTTVHQAADSHYRSFTLALGARLSRHNLHARLGGSNVETLLYGLYLGRGEQLMDNHTAIFHDRPHCRSWEVYKGVMAERARGVFNGKVIVQPEAQQTDAKQTNRNLLLSDHARVDTKPQLEIFADDVKCTHGATVGKLDEQQRYYLRTRGIAGRAAELMLINAFVAEVLDEVTEPRLRGALAGLVHTAMNSLIG